MSHAPEPSYSIVKQDEECELRLYDQVAIAEMPARGDRKPALNVAFKALFRYINGHNQVKRKLKMTVPVLQVPDGANAWHVGFVMPSGMVAANLPQPLDTQISLRDAPGRLCAAHRFSGTVNERRLNNHREQLEDWVQRTGYRMVGDMFNAYYNPPWTLPFLRRNEILAAVEPDPNGEKSAVSWT